MSIRTQSKWTISDEAIEAECIAIVQPKIFLALRIWCYINTARRNEKSKPLIRNKTMSVSNKQLFLLHTVRWNCVNFHGTKVYVLSMHYYYYRWCRCCHREEVPPSSDLDTIFFFACCILQAGSYCIYMNVYCVLHFIHINVACARARARCTSPISSSSNLHSTE